MALGHVCSHGSTQMNAGARAAACLAFIVCAVAVASPSQTLALWPHGAPGSAGNRAPETLRINSLGEEIVSNVHNPSLAVFLPAADTTPHPAVIVLPGGGHTELWMDHEGYNVAGYLAGHGVAAFVLKY